MSPTQGKTGGMDRELPGQMPARWLEQIRAMVQDLIGTSAADTHRYFEETRRHFDVVGEGLRADIRAIAEGQVGLVERLDQFQQEVRRDFRRVERRLLRLEARR
jgi:hypothetical protein